MPWTWSVPRVAVDPLMVWMAPKLIGSPALMVTQRNLSFLQTSVAPVVEALFLPQAAASTTKTATRASRRVNVGFLMLPSLSAGPIEPAHHSSPEGIAPRKTVVLPLLTPAADLNLPHMTSGFPAVRLSSHPGIYGIAPGAGCALSLRPREGCPEGPGTVERLLAISPEQGLHQDRSHHHPVGEATGLGGQ